MKDKRVQKQTIWNKNRMLERMLNNPSTIKTILDFFLQDVPIQIETLSISIENSDWDQIKFLSHSIKGSALNVSGEALWLTASSIEQQAFERNIDEINSLYPQLVENYTDLEKQLTDYLEMLNCTEDNTDL